MFLLGAHDHHLSWGSLGEWMIVAETYSLKYYHWNYSPLVGMFGYDSALIVQWMMQASQKNQNQLGPSGCSCVSSKSLHYSTPTWHLLYGVEWDHWLFMNEIQKIWWKWKTKYCIVQELTAVAFSALRGQPGDIFAPQATPKSDWSSQVAMTLAVPCAIVLCCSSTLNLWDNNGVKKCLAWKAKKTWLVERDGCFPSSKLAKINHQCGTFYVVAQLMMTVFFILSIVLHCFSV